MVALSIELPEELAAARLDGSPGLLDSTAAHRRTDLPRDAFAGQKTRIDNFGHQVSRPSASSRPSQQAKCGQAARMAGIPISFSTATPAVLRNPIA